MCDLINAELRSKQDVVHKFLECYGYQTSISSFLDSIITSMKLSLKGSNDYVQRTDLFGKFLYYNIMQYFHYCYDTKKLSVFDVMIEAHTFGLSKIEDFSEKLVMSTESIDFTKVYNNLIANKLLKNKSSDTNNDTTIKDEFTFFMNILYNNCLILNAETYELSQKSELNKDDLYESRLSIKLKTFYIMFNTIIFSLFISKINDKQRIVLSLKDKTTESAQPDYFKGLSSLQLSAPELGEMKKLFSFFAYWIVPLMSNISDKIMESDSVPKKRLEKAIEVINDINTSSGLGNDLDIILIIKTVYDSEYNFTYVPKPDDNDIKAYISETSIILSFGLSYKLALILQTFFFQINIKGYNYKTIKHIIHNMKSIKEGTDTSYDVSNFDVLLRTLKWFDFTKSISFYQNSKYFDKGIEDENDNNEDDEDDVFNNDDDNNNNNDDFPNTVFANLKSLKFDKESFLSVFNNLIIILEDFLYHGDHETLLKMLYTLKNTKILDLMKDLIENIQKANTKIIYDYCFSINTYLNSYMNNIFMIFSSAIHKIRNAFKKILKKITGLEENKDFKKQINKIKMVVVLEIFKPLFNIIELEYNFFYKNQNNKLLKEFFTDRMERFEAFFEKVITENNPKEFLTQSNVRYEPYSEISTLRDENGGFSIQKENHHFATQYNINNCLFRINYLSTVMTTDDIESPITLTMESMKYNSTYIQKFLLSIYNIDYRKTSFINRSKSLRNVDNNNNDNDNNQEEEEESKKNKHKKRKSKSKKNNKKKSKENSKSNDNLTPIEVALDEYIQKFNPNRKKKRNNNTKKYTKNDLLLVIGDKFGITEYNPSSALYSFLFHETFNEEQSKTIIECYMLSNDTIKISDASVDTDVILKYNNAITYENTRLNQKDSVTYEKPTTKMFFYGNTYYNYIENIDNPTQEQLNVITNRYKRAIQPVILPKENESNGPNLWEQPLPPNAANMTYEELRKLQDPNYKSSDNNNNNNNNSDDKDKKRKAQPPVIENQAITTKIYHFLHTRLLSFNVTNISLVFKMLPIYQIDGTSNFFNNPSLENLLPSDDMYSLILINILFKQYISKESVLVNTEYNTKDKIGDDEYYKKLLNMIDAYEIEDDNRLEVSITSMKQQTSLTSKNASSLLEVQDFSSFQLFINNLFPFKHFSRLFWKQVQFLLKIEARNKNISKKGQEGSMFIQLLTGYKEGDVKVAKSNKNNQKQTKENKNKNESESDEDSSDEEDKKEMKEDEDGQSDYDPANDDNMSDLSDGNEMEAYDKYDSESQSNVIESKKERKQKEKLLEEKRELEDMKTIIEDEDEDEDEDEEDNVLNTIKLEDMDTVLNTFNVDSDDSDIDGEEKAKILIDDTKVDSNDEESEEEEDDGYESSKTKDSIDSLKQVERDLKKRFKEEAKKNKKNSKNNIIYEDTFNTINFDDL
jgi:hypothetical protein